MSGRRRQVDPSTMKTEAGREMADRLNRTLETTETQHHRLMQVLNEYFLYTDVYQRDLAEAAAMWAFATLAVDERRDECQSYFYAYVDWMYTITEDAKKTLNDSQREQIAVAADAVQQHLVTGINEILQSSARTLQTYDEQSPSRIVALMLHRFRGTDLEHSHWSHLRDLIGQCVIMCQVARSYKLGIDSDADLLKAINELATGAAQISNTVCDAIEQGQLVVQDGRVVNPIRDDDEDLDEVDGRVAGP